MRRGGGEGDAGSTLHRLVRPLRGTSPQGGGYGGSRSIGVLSSRLRFRPPRRARRGGDRALRLRHRVARDGTRACRRRRSASAPRATRSGAASSATSRRPSRTPRARSTRRLRALGVTRDGRPEPYFTERHGDFIRIYAGDEDVFLDTGSYTYVLTYETDRQVRWFDGKPELFWNVTGNDGRFRSCRRARSLTLPDSVAPVRWTAYTGALRRARHGFARRGRRRRRADRRDDAAARAGRGADHRRGDSGRARSTADRRATNARYFLLDYRAWIIGIVGLLRVLAYYLWAWNAVGRDPKGGTIIPLFHPPEGVSPALASYIRNWGFGANAWKAFTAAALSLAVRGLLVFDQEGKDLMLRAHRRAADGCATTLPAGEKTRARLGRRAGRPRARSTRPTARRSPRSAQTFQKSVQDGERRPLLQAATSCYFVVGVVLSRADGRLRSSSSAACRTRISGCSSACCSSASSSSVFLVPIIAALFDGRGGIASSSRSLIVARRGARVLLYFLASSFARRPFGGSGGSIVSASLRRRSATTPSPSRWCSSSRC